MLDDEVRKMLHDHDWKIANIALEVGYLAAERGHSFLQAQKILAKCFKREESQNANQS